MSDANLALDVIGNQAGLSGGQQRRSTPSYQRAYEYLKSGKFGDIVMAEMTWRRQSARKDGVVRRRTLAQRS
jgi:predicted dehydrogenase